MFESVPPEAAWLFAPVTMLVVYFAKKTHKEIDDKYIKLSDDVAKKLDIERHNQAEARTKQELDELKRENKDALQKLEERGKEDRKFLYEQMLEKVTSTEVHLSKEIASTNTHLSGKIDDLMKYIMEKK